MRVFQSDEQMVGTNNEFQWRATNGVKNRGKPSGLLFVPRSYCILFVFVQNDMQNLEATNRQRAVADHLA